MLLPLSVRPVYAWNNPLAAAAGAAAPAEEEKKEEKKEEEEEEEDVDMSRGGLVGGDADDW